MYERLLDKDSIPTIDEFLAHIGKESESFECIDDYLKCKLGSESKIKLDAHSRCWTMSYHKARKNICDIHAERDAFTIVTRLSEENIHSMYDGLSPYARKASITAPFVLGVG